MSKTYIRAVRMGRWLPANDSLAAAIARLMILREDLMLELHGVVADEILDLDGHSASYRHIYFLRSSVRTLWEIQGALTMILRNPEFKRMIEKRPAKERAQLRDIAKRLNTASHLTKTVRDNIGGHVLHHAVQKALNNIPYDNVGMIEVGRTIKRTHFKMAGDIVAEIFADGEPEVSKLAKIEKDFQILAGLLPVIVRLEQVLEIYLSSRGLL